MLLFLFFLTGYLSGTACLLEAFEIPVTGTAFWVTLAVFGLLFFVLYRFRRGARYTLPLTAALFVLLCIRYAQAIAEGGTALLRTIHRIVLLYTGASDQAWQLTGDALAAVEVFLLFFFFLLGGLLFLGIYVKRGRWVAICYSICVIGISLSVGKAPSLSNTFLVAFSCLGMVAAGRVRQPSVQRKVLLMTGAVALACLLLGQYVMQPLLQPVFSHREMVKEQIQDTSLLKELLAKLPDIAGGWLTRGGLGEGDLRGSNGFFFTGKTALTVRTEEEPGETMYLKGYVGTEYTGDSWEEQEDEDWEMWKDRIYQFLRQFSDIYQEQPLAVEVEVERADPKYSYDPYYSMMAAQTDASSVYHYEWLPRERVSRWMDASSFFFAGGSAPYQDTGFSAFLSYPGELTQLSNLVDSHPAGTDVDNIVDTVVETLGEMASYSLDVGRFPQGEDVAEYFLFQEGEGYCIHFATAAVLMLRMYGIPARYVEGYVVPEKDFVREGDTYVAQVSDERAHAWAEIYRPDRGWTPVEATPGFVEDTAESEAQTESQTQSQPQTESTAPQNETATESEDAPGLEGGVLQEVLFRILMVCVCLLTVMVLGLYARYRYLQKKRQTMSAKNLFPILYRALVLGGWEETTDCQDAEFSAKVAGKFPWLKEERMSEVMEIVMKANFGPTPATEEESQKVRDLYVQTLQNLCREWGLPKRIWMRYVRVI